MPTDKSGNGSSLAVRPADLVIRARGNEAMTPDRALYRAIAFQRERIVAASSNPNSLDALVKARR